jgi:ketosteroid isomerase-like protein
MSQQNVKTVLDAGAAFNRGDLATWFEYYTDDMDYRPVEGAIDDQGQIHGKDGYRAYVQDWLDTFNDVRLEPVEQIAVGEDKVIAVVRARGRAKLSGVEPELTFAVLYTIRDGKIARGREYWTRDEALEAVELSE